MKNKKHLGKHNKHLPCHLEFLVQNMVALHPLELATGQKIPAENRDDKRHIIFEDQHLQ